MKNAGVPLLLVVLGHATAGCPRDNNRPPETVKEGSLKPGKQKDSWTYHSKELDFSLQLPSTNWKEGKKRQFIADFWCNPLGSPMLVGVTSVKKQTKGKFQASIPPFRAEFEKDDDYLVRPTIQEGKTASELYVFAAMCEKGTEDTQFIYVAKAAVWIQDKALTVVSIFEGQGKMRSKAFKSIEYAEFEKAAKSICLSPE